MPDENTYGFNKQDAESIIGGIGGWETEIPDIRQTGGTGGSLRHVYPPSGGIPAATWNATTEGMTPGSAMCRVAIKTGGIYLPTSTTLLVENPVGTVIGTTGKPMTVGRNTSGAWTTLVEDCTSTDEGGGGDPNPEPPVPDAISSGTSKGVDMGYALGV